MSLATLDRQVELVRAFLQRYPNPTGKDVLFCQWESQEDQEDWQDLLDSPEDFMKAFKEAGHPTIVDLIDPIELKDLTATKFLNKMIAIQGKVVAISDIEPHPVRLTFRCNHCGATYTRYDAKQPKCDCDSPEVELKLDESEFTDKQIVKVQELLPSGNPAKLTLIITGEKQLRKVTAGDKIEALGIYRAEAYKDKSNKLAFVKKFDTYCINNLARNEKEFLPTPADIERFRKDAEEPQFWDMLIGSIAPHIAGFSEIKETIALLIASEDTEQPVNAFLVGDPSVAKSLMLLYAAKLSSNGHCISAAGAKWASLSAHAQKDEETGSWIIQPGAFTLADQGLLCIDELQAIEEEIPGKMNEVLEQKVVSYAKAGQVGVLPARCAVLCGSNSYFGAWRSDLDISENLRFLGKTREALISRFPLIFILTDVVNEDNDRKIARQVLENNSNKAIQKYLEDWQGKDGNLYYGFRTLKKFFLYLRSVPLPEVPEEIYDAIEQWYIDLRQNKEDRFNKLIKARFLDKAIKLMKLHARILHKQQCDITDFDFAVDLLKKSMNIAAFEPQTGELDSNLVNGNKASVVIKKEESKEKQFWRVFDNLNNGEFTPRKELIEALVTEGWEKIDVEKFITSRITKGEIILRDGYGKLFKV